MARGGKRFGSGRKKTPSAINRLRGNPGKRAVNHAEPKPSAGLPTRPAWLKGEARKLFPQIKRILADLGVATKADGPALALLVNTYAEYIAADAAIKGAAGVEQTEYSTTDQNGNTIYRLRPVAKVRADSHRRLMAAMATFGLEPSSRSKLKAEKPEQVDPFEEFLRTGQAGPADDEKVIQ